MTYNEGITLLMLPVMIELESMGINPIMNMSGFQTMDKVEKRYIAVMKAMKKYPKWTKEVSGWWTNIVRR